MGQRVEGKHVKSESMTLNNWGLHATTWGLGLTKRPRRWDGMKLSRPPRCGVVGGQMVECHLVSSTVFGGQERYSICSLMRVGVRNSGRSGAFAAILYKWGVKVTDEAWCHGVVVVGNPPVNKVNWLNSRDS